MMFTEITDKLERAARNGERAHLDINLVRALVAHPAYAMLAAERTKELISTWQSGQGTPPAGLNSGPTGSISEPIATTGASAGTTPPHVLAAGEALASEEAAKLTRQKRRVRH